MPLFPALSNFRFLSKGHPAQHVVVPVLSMLCGPIGRALTVATARLDVICKLMKRYNNVFIKSYIEIH